MRNARGTSYPDPVLAASLCEAAGADGITAHLREDRRHICDEDVARLRATVRTMLNLEMAATDEMIAIAERTKPDVVTLVPERREERTTEGGLDVKKQWGAVEATVRVARRVGFRVSLFIAPDVDAVALAKDVGATQIELHTGEYCHAAEPGGDPERRRHELERLRRATQKGVALGLDVAAGHGLHRHNIGPVLAIDGIDEVNVGHAVIADAVLFGLDWAVRGLRDAMDRGFAERGRRS